MALPRPASPRALMRDLRAFLGERSKHQLIAAFFAVAMPLTIMVGFYYDAQTNIAPGPQLIYVESWPADRTDEQIREKQAVDLEKRKAAELERQRQFQELERRLGM